MNPVPLFLIIVTLPLFASGCVPKETDGRPQSWPGLQLGFPPPIWYKPSNYHGGKKYEANYKDGKKDGLWLMWHKNGQKMVEGKMKNGKWEELVNVWHKNGQKREEINYKNGKPVEGSEKFWNSKGEPVDTYKEAEK